MGEKADRVERCLACVRKITDFQPKVALVLGSGLGDLAEQIEITVTIAYSVLCLAISARHRL